MYIIQIPFFSALTWDFPNLNFQIKQGSGPTGALMTDRYAHSPIHFTPSSYLSYWGRMTLRPCLELDETQPAPVTT